MGSKGQNLHRYTARERAEALKLAEQVGSSEAARRLGMPLGTISCWRCVAKKRAREAAGKTETVVRKAGAGDQNQKQNAGSDHRRRVARAYTPSQRAEALEMVAAEGATATRRKLGMSRFSLYEWERKQRAFDKGRATDTPLADTDDNPTSERDARVLDEWRQHPGLGPSQIRNQLRRNGFKVSVRTARMVMEEHGYAAPKVKRVESHDRRYEAVRPNHLWHMDFLQRYVHKQKVSVLFLVDDFSRFIIGFGLWDEERVQAVVECFESATSRHGKPESVMSDGGSAFWAWRGVSRFTRLLEEMGVDQIVAKTPQTNGKLEVLNANVQKELFNQERFFDLGEAAARLRAWVSFYNFRRTHHALGGLLVPADRYFGRADEVLAHVEAGHAPDGIGEPIAISERQLDLLRVSSRAGKLELWMMGERLWPQASSA